MLFILLIVLGLAVYGGFSAISALTPQSSDVQTPSAVEGGLIDMMKQYAVEAASTGLNFRLEELPAYGCGESILSPDKVYELVMSLPEPQRSALAQVLSSGASVWTAQMYKDADRIGLCLPVQGKLVAFPIAENAPGLTSLFDSMQSLLPR